VRHRRTNPRTTVIANPRTTVILSEAQDLRILFFVVAVAVVLAFLVVIPNGDLLLPLPSPLSLPLPFGIRAGLQPGIQPAAKRPTASAEGRSEATDSIAFAFAVVFLSSFSAQKSHVKPQNHLTNTNKTTSTWRISSLQPAILDI
jgi:hypothetical protein